MGFFVEPLILLFASLISITLTYYKVSIATYQIIIVILMVVLLVLYNKFSSKPIHIKYFSPAFLTGSVIFICSLFAQLLVISTGGLFSPFLIMFHLFSLAASFLINLLASLSFIVFSLVVLGFNIYLNPAQIALVRDDLGAVLLYLISFVIIVPLSQIITSRYHLKDQLSKILSQKVKVGELILGSLTELVLITDTNLNIISINEAAQKTLKLSQSDAIGENLFEVIDLKDSEGVAANLHTLSIDRVLVENTNRIMDGFRLFIKGGVSSYGVSIQIKPIKGANNDVAQLVFVITEGQNLQGTNLTHKDLQSAEKKASLFFRKLRDQLNEVGVSNLSLELLLFEKIDQDIIVTKELEDHPLSLQPTLNDFAKLIYDVISDKLTLSKSLGVKLNFILPENDNKEMTLIELQKGSSPGINLPNSDYNCTIDKKWFTIFFKKIIDLSILLSSQKKDSIVKVIISQPTEKYWNIEVTTNYQQTLTDFEEIFRKYFGQHYEATNLKLGSGLEGFIVKYLSTQLNISINIKYATDGSGIAFNLTLERKLLQ